MAVPEPERELERLRTRAKTGLAPVTVITGASAFFRGEAVEIALGAVPQGRDVRVIDGGTETDGRELQDLRGAGLFGGGTWLVVRRGEQWLADRAEDLPGVLEGIGRGCGLIVEATKFDKRTRVGKTLAAQDVYEFRDLYDSPYDRTRSPLEAELIKWVANRSRALGVRMSLEAAYVAVMILGKDPAALLGELRRLAAQPDLAALAKSRVLTPDDLRGRLSVSFASTPFELAEALLDHDRARCLRSIDAMFARGVTKGRDGTVDRGGVFPFTVSMLFQSVAKAHRGRMLFDRGTPANALPAKVGVYKFTDRFVRQVTGNPVPRLRRALLLLRDAQRRLRATGEDPRRLLEQMVARYFGGGT